VVKLGRVKKIRWRGGLGVIIQGENSCTREQEEMSGRRVLVTKEKATNKCRKKEKKSGG